jgi:hypothetical protein
MIAACTCTGLVTGHRSKTGTYSSFPCFPCRYLRARARFCSICHSLFRIACPVKLYSDRRQPQVRWQLMYSRLQIDGDGGAGVDRPNNARANKYVRKMVPRAREQGAASGERSVSRRARCRIHLGGGSGLIITHYPWMRADLIEGQARGGFMLQ